MKQALVNTMVAQLFCSYSHKDELLRDELEKHLIGLRRHGKISSWHDRRIAAGEEWRNQIDAHLEAANLILLLVSSDFLASDYCYDIEMSRSMEKYEAGEAHVIPIILRPVNWADMPFAKLQVLPKDGKPVVAWESRDAAFVDISEGIQEAISQLPTKQKVSSFTQSSRLARPAPATPSSVGYVIHIEAKVQRFNSEQLEEIVQRLQELSGDVNLTLKRVEYTSIFLIFEGSEEGLMKLRFLYDQRRLSIELNYFVEKILLEAEFVYGHTDLSDEDTSHVPKMTPSNTSINIYIGNLPSTTTEEEIQELFSAYGTVESVKLIVDRETGGLRGFGFVEMSSGVEEAIAALDGIQLERGRALTVNRTRPRDARHHDHNW